MGGTIGGNCAKYSFKEGRFACNTFDLAIRSFCDRSLYPGAPNILYNPKLPPVRRQMVNTVVNVSQIVGEPGASDVAFFFLQT